MGIPMMGNYLINIIALRVPDAKLLNHLNTTAASPWTMYLKISVLNFRLTNVMSQFLKPHPTIDSAAEGNLV